MKSHKEAESVNFTTTLSFCQEGAKNPSNVAFIDRQNSNFPSNDYSTTIRIIGMISPPSQSCTRLWHIFFLTELSPSLTLFCFFCCFLLF